MTLKEALMEELQKLRLSRERPPLLQTPKGERIGKQTKKDKLMAEVKEILDSLEEEKE